jgi:hypothetical protein
VIAFIREFNENKLNKASEGAISEQAAKEGLSKEFVEKFMKEIMCPICQDMLKETVYLKTCSHRFCKE